MMQTIQLFSQLTVFCQGVLVSKVNDSSLSSAMVDMIADRVFFNLENNLSGSAVITGNVVRIFSNI